MVSNPARQWMSTIRNRTPSAASVRFTDVLDQQRGGDRVPDYPTLMTSVNHMGPVPRRVRGTVGARTVLDTTTGTRTTSPDIYFGGELLERSTTHFFA